MKQLRLTVFSVCLYMVGVLNLVLYLITVFSAVIFAEPAFELIMALLFILPIYFGSRLLSKAYRDKASFIMKTAFTVFLIAYIGLLLNFTLFDPMFGRSGTVITIFTTPELLKNYMANSFNVVPFKTIIMFIQALINDNLPASVVITNLCGNFVVLTPLAILLPTLSEKCNKHIIFILITVMLVLTVELLQLFFVTGSCDIDDVILNVLGAFLAFVVIKRFDLKKITLI